MPEETLLIEWPKGEAAPTKYWLSTIDKNISFRSLVDIAKMRWRVERDYQERCPRSGRNGTSPTRSRPFTAGCSSRSPAPCRAAHAARAASLKRCGVFYDAVRLIRPTLTGS
jgi:hypothetical protein